ncbi:HAUS augmin-like complex subunit 6 isoform X2 [Erinaceus europaeus]|uniref:HAUS augmin-like complex subunit 6 isoform X2 n=1 Tax=Erinaceus europaeus TaxID=9365 RepID=A0ABM3Y3G4_ERIEU|nr:HAUS augmin-like complex subunit 6 isoform X2 [Erinaceus europaeus]
MSSARATSFEKEHLWMYLLALGFEPGPATVACGKIVSHTHLGVHMFDKQNRDAFQIVSYFLFQTLDQSFTKEVFKHCWPPFDRKSETEFRKHCYEWLKKISVECGSNFPQVVGSLFLSPGGSKFIHLMYHFARFVAIKYIQSNSKNSSIRFTEPFIGKSQDLHKCIARCHVARNRFLQILQREDCVIRKYQENAQMELCDDQINIQEKIQKVRSLWASVNETLVLLEKEREVVSSVLSLANSYTLDGTNVAINIPSLLLDKIEKQMCQLHIGNVYEAGKLNLLTVIQLLNEVLKIMKYECCQSDQAKLTLDLHFLEKEAKIQKERLSDLKQMRCKIKEDLTTIRQSVVEKQGEWHKKWKAFLGVSPFSLINGSTPAVDLLPPMSPLSFDPASEEVYATSILLKYPALLPDTLKQQNQENDCGRASDMLGTGYDLANSSTSVSLQPASSSDKSTVTLFEKDVTVKTPREKDKAVSKRIPKFEVEGFSSSTTAKTVESSAFGECLPTKKSSHFQKEQDHLVEEVARAVLSDSPQPSEGKEVKLEELIDSLVSNPFLTRKQIPRTPENLINEIRSSWRKAVETDNRSADPIQMDPESEVLPESSPVLHNQGEFDKNNFFLATTVSSQSHLPEEEFITDCLVSVPQKHASYIDKSATQNQSDLSNKKITCKQNLECTLQNKLLATSQRQTFSPAIGSRTDVMGSSEEEHIKVLNHSKVSHQEPSIYKTMLWDSFQISSGINSGSFKDTNFSILHETLPEEMDCLSLNSSSCTESSFKLEPNSPMPSGIFPEDVEVKQTTPKSDLNLKAICSRYEALKKSLSKKREGTHLSNPEMFGRYKLELSPAPEDMQIDDMLNILDTKDVHIDYTKPSLRMSLGERKRSLSPLIKFSPVEQKSRPTVPCSFGELLPNLEEEEILNKRFEAKESSADLI